MHDIREAYTVYSIPQALYMYVTHGVNFTCILLHEGLQYWLYELEKPASRENEPEVEGKKRRAMRGQPKKLRASATVFDIWTGV